MPFRYKQLEIPEVILIESRAFEDARGYFMEIYRQSDFEAAGVNEVFTQDNFSHSFRGVLRGLHYQKQPKAQGKLIGVIRGEIFAVALDIRKGSPSYGHWVGVILSDKNLSMLYVPVGFAHGFCITGDEADVFYKTTAEYSPELERGILWNDPELGINWPVKKPILSRKDAKLPLLTEADNDFISG
jgi:dTDP-4-dehydrorhamnose 3,5-epimerase